MSDSSCSSDAREDSDDDIMQDARQKQKRASRSQDRNRIKPLYGVIHRVTRGTSLIGRNHLILSTSAHCQTLKF